MDYEGSLGRYSHVSGFGDHGYIANDSPANALVWLECIYEKAESLIEYPYKCPEAEGACNTHIRDCTFGNFRLIYKVESELIRIMAVKRCAQEKDEEEVRKS